MRYIRRVLGEAIHHREHREAKTERFHRRKQRAQRENEKQKDLPGGNRENREKQTEEKKDPLTKEWSLGSPLVEDSFPLCVSLCCLCSLLLGLFSPCLSV